MEINCQTQQNSFKNLPVKSPENYTVCIYIRSMSMYIVHVHSYYSIAIIMDSENAPYIFHFIKNQFFFYHSI